MPLLDRDRDADMYATTITNFGLCLIALGEFDRALSLHTQALEVFQRPRLRGGSRQATQRTRRPVHPGRGTRAGALDAARGHEVHGRVGSGEARAAALRMAGNVSGALGDPRAALAYLRESMEQDVQPDAMSRNPRTDRGPDARARGPARRRTRTGRGTTRRQRADARGCAHRAGTPAPRATRFPPRSRMLRAADGLYVSLGLDFDRIETHTLMSQSLLATG